MNKQNVLYLSVAAIVLTVLGPVLHVTALTALGGIASLMVWIMGMIVTARSKRWGWFVGILLFTPLATLIYGIAGPTAPKMGALPSFPTPA